VSESPSPPVPEPAPEAAAPLRNAVDELAAFVDSNETMSRYFGDPAVYADLQPRLKRFLSATMDQVRTSHALDCTGRILKQADLEDVEAFREGVWKREVTGVIHFPGQRDHTAHTLNNWLLGWYIYSHSPPMRQALDAAIAARKWAGTKFGADVFFGHAWLFTSLLHDIGYLFEGSLSNMETGYQSTHATIGLRATDEYFHFGFWKHMSLNSAGDRRLSEHRSRQLPVAPGDPSLSRIAIYLRTLGDLDALARGLRAAARDGGPDLPDELPGDAFELWKLHFSSFGQAGAATRIEGLETAFLDYVVRGMPGLGIRVLDHGVCSGLVQLKISAFFYQLMAASLEDVASADAADPAVSRAAGKLTRREEGLAHQYDYEYWWSGVVWATAAAALHNVQQRKGDWCDGVRPGPLGLSEEPLTYLGILVDCLQDWDRYFVFETPGKLPIQGVDVRLGTDAGKIVVIFPEGSKKQVEKICEDLDAGLKDWKSLVALHVGKVPAEGRGTC